MSAKRGLIGQTRNEFLMAQDTEQARLFQFYRSLDILARAAKLAGKRVVVEIRDQRPVQVINAGRRNG